MKSLLAAAILALVAVPLNAETRVGGSIKLTEPVGSMISINIYSASPSVFRGTFFQTFSFNQSIQDPTPTITFNKSFDFNGNSNFNIVSQFNQNMTIFSSPGWNSDWMN